MNLSISEKFVEFKLPQKANYTVLCYPKVGVHLKKYLKSHEIQPSFIYKISCIII